MTNEADSPIFFGVGRLWLVVRSWENVAQIVAFLRSRRGNTSAWH